MVVAGDFMRNDVRNRSGNSESTRREYPGHRMTIASASCVAALQFAVLRIVGIK